MNIKLNAVFFSLLFFISFSSCKEEVDAEYKTQIEAIKSDPSIENKQAFVDAILSHAASKPSIEEKIQTLDKGLTLLEKYDFKEGTLLLTEEKFFIASDPDQRKEFAVELSKEYKEAGNENLAKAIDLALSKSKSLENFLKGLAQKSSKPNPSLGIEPSLGNEYIKATKLIVNLSGDSTKSGEFLFRAAEMANAIDNTDQAIALLDRVVEEYPQDPKAPVSLFMKGFIYDTKVENLDDARDVYTLFLERYPEHQLARDVQFLIDNLGVSGDSLILSAKNNGKSAAK